MSRLHARRQLLAVGLSVVLAAPIAVATTTTAATAGVTGPNNFVTLARGDAGPRVGLVQRALSVKPVTTHYNDKTKRAVRHFQNRRGIKVTGIVNERTMNALRNKWENIQQARTKWRQKYHRIMRTVRNQKGDPYRYGAAGPNAFDCSGLTMFVYGRATKYNLQHRASAQFRQGHRISRKQAHRGDLVFMYNGGGIYHAAIYAGHGKIWHASTPGTNVKKDPIWTSSVLFARVIKKP